jgi:flagellar biosynthesis protein FlhF
MQVRTFRGKTLEECFQQVKAQLGREAVILQSRTYRPFLGRFGTPRHEVMAALDVNIPDRRAAQPAREQPQNDVRESRESSMSPGTRSAAAVGQSQGRPSERGIYGYSSGEERGAFRPLPPRPTEQNTRPSYLDQGPVNPSTEERTVYERRIEKLEQQLSSLSTNMSKLTEAALARKNAKNGIKPGIDQEPQEQQTPHAAIVKRLSEMDVAAPVIKKLLDDIPSELPDNAAASDIRTKIAQRLLIANQIEAAPGRTRVVAFIGSTGVGKTTTLTKIAARLSLVSNYSVGIITMDTHRIAAAKQLETYGDILRVPVKVAYSGAEVVAAVQQFAAEKRNFVLIDTAGRSPNDALPLAEVSTTLKELTLVTRILCVPATLSAANFDYMVSRFFTLLEPDSMIVTKLDEAADEAYLGRMLNVQTKFGLPLAYFTNGQRVPDDLSRPDAHLIADKILPQGPF